MQSEKIRPYFLLIVLLGAFALAAFILAPFLKPLILAAVFAFVFQGTYLQIARWLGNRSSVAAFVTVLISIVLILVPLSVISLLVANEAHALYISLEAEGGQSTVAQFFLKADEKLGGTVPGLGEFSRDISANIDTYTKQVLQWIVSNSGAIFSSVSSLILSLFIFFIALYYLLRDGKQARAMFIELSPLKDAEDKGVLVRLELAVNSVIKGNLTIAVIQGMLTAIGFLIFGVPNAILWGSVTAVAALIPGVGTSLVFIPAIIFLFFTGSTLSAAGLLVWGLLAVGLIDNLLGPRLIGRGMQLHPLLVLLSVLGGISFFGPAGIFFGPLSLSLLFALLSIYIDGEKTYA